MRNRRSYIGIVGVVSQVRPYGLGYLGTDADRKALHNQKYTNTLYAQIDPGTCLLYLLSGVVEASRYLITTSGYLNTATLTPSGYLTLLIQRLEV